jgi:putative MATE family efflux protein
MRNQSSKMGTENIGSLLIHFSVPATASMLVTASYNIIDTIFVGRLGVEAIAALSIAFPFQMLLGAIGIGTGVGAASLIARSLGAGQVEVARKAVGQVIFLSLFFGIIFALVGYLYMEPILVMFGATPEIVGPAGEYMSVITGGSVMFFLIMGLNNVVRGEGNPRFSMSVMIATAIVNIILDPIFIFVLNMGVQGAAVATVLAKIVGVALILHYFISGRGEIKINFSCLKPELENIIKIYVIGFPAMIMQASTNISLILANNILAQYGHVPIAALGLIFRLIMFALMPVIGISQGLLPIIGYNFGAGKLPRISEALNKGLLVGVAVVTFFGIIYFTWPVLFLSIFTGDSELLAYGGQAMRIMVFMFPLVGGQIVFTTYFQAAGRGLPSLILSILREMLIFIPLLLVLSRVFGLDGVWYARPASDLLAFSVTYLLITRDLKRQGISPGILKWSG